MIEKLVAIELCQAGQIREVWEVPEEQAKVLLALSLPNGFYWQRQELHFTGAESEFCKSPSTDN